jgi:hypothetical protein
MSFGASIAVLAFVIAVIAAVAFARLKAPRRKSRKRRTEQALDPLSDPPTITHYGHG